MGHLQRARVCSLPMRHGTRMVLHLPPAENLGDLLCACGQSLASDPYHFHWCRQSLRRGLTFRHDLVKSYVKAECLTAGWYAEEEVRVLRPIQDVFKKTGAVVDIVVHTPTGPLAIDVSGTCPSAPSYVVAAGRKSM